jgi:hypothetical protein
VLPFECILAFRAATLSRSAILVPLSVPHKKTSPLLNQKRCSKLELCQYIRGQSVGELAQLYAAARFCAEHLPVLRSAIISYDGGRALTLPVRTGFGEGGETGALESAKSNTFGRNSIPLCTRPGTTSQVGYELRPLTDGTQILGTRHISSHLDRSGLIRGQSMTLCRGMAALGVTRINVLENNTFGVGCNVAVRLFFKDVDR